MGRVRVEVSAWQDLMEIAEYLSRAGKDSTAGMKLFDEFDRKAEIYARQPGMGDLLDDPDDGLRSFTFKGRYLAVYEPLSDGINVMRVLDARSDYGRRLDE